MSYLKPKNPYSPGYALPENVLTEPKTRGTITTNWAPRGTIDSYRAAKPRSAWASGYALPKNVLREKPGQGVLTTTWAPKGTIDSYVSPSMRTPLPADVVDRGGQQVLEGLYEAKIPGKPAVSKDDVIGRFGREAAREIVRAAKGGKTPEERIAIVKNVLSSLSPSLRTEVENKAKTLQAKRRMPALEALEKAIAMALANHLAEQWMTLAEGRRPKDGLLSVGGVSWSEMYGSRDLSGWDDIGDAFKSAGNAIKNTAQKVANAACKAANHPAAGVAASGVAVANGAPPDKGQQAVDTAKQVCAATEKYRDTGTKTQGSVAPGAAPKTGMRQMRFDSTAYQQLRTGTASGGPNDPARLAAQGGPMSTTTKVALGVGAVAAVGALVYLAKRK